VTVVALEDADPNGLAQMIAGLIEANLRRRPERSALLRPAVFELTARDADVSVTIEAAPGSVRIRGGAARRRADVRVAADSSDLLALASVPLRAGLPDALTTEGRAVLRGVLGRRIRIRGLITHPVRLARLARLLAVG
jgi:predicted lipid carrier protein YhbT